ncbi:MAG: hypothetical protein H0W64_04865 [Gammaproteobacteria bacterium]|nr:hypothetical protein [Gammaproteobacteria bacterium]
MLKNSLAMIVIGTFVAGGSFATPLHIANIFMIDQVVESSSASKKHIQNQQSKFSGTWVGTCNHDGRKDEEKIRIEDEYFDFSIKELLLTGFTQTFYFDVTESKSLARKDHYVTTTSRLTRINDNTIRLEGTGVVNDDSNKETRLESEVFNSTFTVNNNNLIITSEKKYPHGNKDENVDKCLLKRVE